MDRTRKNNGAGRTAAYAALTGAVTFWGGSFVATKLLLAELPMAVLITARFVVGCVVLALALASRGSLRLPDRRDLAAVALLGAIGVTLHQWLQATGLLTAAASDSSWIVATAPIFVALMGWLLLKERMTGWRVAGILLAAAGMGIIVSHGDLAALVSGRAWTVGDGLVLVSALNWAVFTVLSKRLIDDRVAGPGERDRSLVLTFYILVFGLLFCVPWLALEGRWAGIHGLSPQGWGALAFLGVACSGLAYIFWFAGLEAVDATQVGAFLYLEPLVTSIVAAPVLGERITISLALGGATILFGLWMVNRT